MPGPQNGFHWNTLGVARCRSGDPQGVQALKKSMELRQGGNSFDWFFLAMAHRQRSEHVEARRWYDRAVEWMDKSRPEDPELRLFRAEAAGLLGIPPATAR